MRIFPCFTSGCSFIHTIACTISAIPALSSAPRSVCPSVTIMSSPTCCRSSGNFSGEDTIPSDSTISFPSQFFTMRAFTFSPLQSGEVSQWAMNPITGASPLIFAGRVAQTYPFSSISTSSRPSFSSSAFRKAAKVRCFSSALGTVCEFSSDCVSNFVQFINRCIKSIYFFQY